MGSDPFSLTVRHEMLREALHIIEMSWSGGFHSFTGRYLQVEDARTYDLPDELPEIIVAVAGTYREQGSEGTILGVGEEFHANSGNEGGIFERKDFFLLITTGSKTGLRRVWPLAHFTVDGRLLVRSFDGSDVDPGRVHNLRAEPRAHVQIGTQVYEVVSRELRSAEAA